MRTKSVIAGLVCCLVLIYLAAITVEEAYYPRDNYAHADNPLPGPMTDEEIEVREIDVALNRPWDIEFLPDGSMLVSEQFGTVKLLTHASDYTHSVEILKLKPFIRSETGLLGLAVDPDFSSNAYLYVYHTTAPIPEIEHAVMNRIDQYRLDHMKMVFVRTILAKIPGTFAHSGGRLEFGPDHKLYATIGDGPERRRYQDLEYLGAKILRMNRDGGVPIDNPIPGSLIYTIGHRNPQGISWHPLTHEAFSAEHGPSRHDEINRLSPGANYGWDTYACRKQKVTGWRRLLIRFEAVLPDSIVSMGTQFPIFCTEDYTLAPSGMAFVDDEPHPWFGDLFVAALHGQHLRRLRFDSLGNYLGSEVFYRRREGHDPRLRDVEYHDASLYVIGDSRGLTRISPRR